MEDVRASSVLQSFIPEFCEGQIEDLERSIFNYVISMFEEDKDEQFWEQLRRFIGGRLWN
jgi:hypothetical protein